MRYILAALALVAAAACGRESESTQSAPVTEPQTIEVANEPGSLVVYSGRGDLLVGPIIEQFREATAIDVSTKHGGTGAISPIWKAHKAFFANSASSNSLVLEYSPIP